MWKAVLGVGVMLTVLVLGVGVWLVATGCNVELVNSSAKGSIQIIDNSGWKKLLAKELGCGYGFFWLKEDQTQTAKLVPVRSLKVDIVDSLQTNRVGRDRNDADYSFGWKSEGRWGMRLGIQTELIGNDKKGSFVKALAVGLESLRNDLGGVETMGKADQLANQLFSVIVVN